MPSELDVATAIAVIFRAVERLHDLGLKDSRGSKVRREAIHFLWELRGVEKLAAERPHSVAARDYRRQGLTTLLRYEHSIPLATCMQILRAAASDPDVFLVALQKFVRPVIVLDSECQTLSRLRLGSSMPSGSKGDDPLARYVAAGIEIELTKS